MKIKYTKKILKPIVGKSNNIKEVILGLGLSYANGSRKHILNKIKEHKIDISHFNNTRKYITYTNKEMFNKNSKATRSSVRSRVIKNNLIPYICECCGQDENWQGKIMPLILDHKNGINNDHELSNLRFLCSNCDSIQDTYKSKNNGLSNEKRKIRKKIREDEINRKKLIQQQNKEIIYLEQINQAKDKLIESNIDFSIKTWGVESSKILGWSPQYCLKYIKKNLPELIE